MFLISVPGFKVDHLHKESNISIIKGLAVAAEGALSFLFMEKLFGPGGDISPAAATVFRHNTFFN